MTMVIARPGSLQWPAGKFFGVLISAMICSTNSQGHNTPSSGMEEDESDGGAEGGHVLYSQSGMSEKRRRMKQLFAEREQKDAK